MRLKLFKYLIELRRNAKYYERIDINNVKDKTFLGQHLRRILCAAFAIFFLCKVDDGFTQNFVSYASSVLSILIGLFITAIIFSFDKFYQKEDVDEKNYKISISKEIQPEKERKYIFSTQEIIHETSKKSVWNSQSHIYSKQFAFITGYNIVLCIFAIVLLSLSTLFEEAMKMNLTNYNFNFSEISKQEIEVFLIGTLVVIQRLLVLYWIASVVYNTLFIVSSMVNFMAVKIDR